MKERDRNYNTLHAMATHLLHINRTLGFSNEMRVLTMEESRSAGRAWAQCTGPLRRNTKCKPSKKPSQSMGACYFDHRGAVETCFGLSQMDLKGQRCNA